MAEELRKCMTCNHTGIMKTWLGNYNAPQLVVLILLCFYLIPGLLFIAFAWGKYKCPICGKIGSNRAITQQPVEILDREKKCPFCAENIKYEAIVCRYCSRDLPTIVEAES